MTAAPTMACTPAASESVRLPLAGVSLGVDARSLRGPHTGYAMYLRALLRPIVAAGAQVTLVSDGPIEPNPDVDGCAQVTIGPDESAWRWEQTSLCRHLQSADYDLYLAARNFGLPWRYRGRTTLLVTIHDLIPWLFPRLYFWKKPRFTLLYLASLFITLRRADAILTVSEASRRDVARLAGRKPVYAHWIRLARSNVATVETNARAPYFAYLGGMDPRKNNRLLLAAFARFRAGGGREELVLIGRGYEPLQPLVASLGLQDAIHLTGYVDDRERSLLLAGATALVYPSLYEGFGLPVAEALQHGVRVITGRGGSLTEIGGAAAEYVDPITVDSLADAMRRVAGEPADERFRQNAREQVARFTSAQLDEELVATFVTLAGRCGGNVPVRA